MKMPIDAPFSFFWGRRGIDPKWGGTSTILPKGTCLHAETSYDIDSPNQSISVTCARDKVTKKYKERNLTRANWLFAQNTHVVGSKSNFACW